MQTPITVTTFMGCPNTDVSQTIAHLLKTNPENMLKAIVPKNIKAWRRKQKIKNVIPTAERLVKLGKGCSCCTIRSDILVKIKRLFGEQNCNQIVIQALQNADFTILAKTFTVPDENGFILSDVAQLKNMTMIISFVERHNCKTDMKLIFA